MELKQILRIALRWWWLMAIPVLVVAVVTAQRYTPPAPTYRVTLRFATGSEPAATLSPEYDRYYAWLTSEYIANGLADITRTRAFAEAVAERLAAQGLTVDPGALQAALVSDNVQSVTVVDVLWPHAYEAEAIADAVGKEYIESAGKYYPQMDKLGVVARQLDTPFAVPMAPSLRSQLVGPAVRLGLAGVFGASLVFLAHYVDPSVREKADLEALGLSVLSCIPPSRHRLEQKKPEG